MNEPDWLACSAPERMLGFLRRRRLASRRKLLLLSCACVRRIWDSLTDEHSRQGIEISELFADGLATPDEQRAAIQAAARVGLITLPSMAAYFAASGDVAGCLDAALRSLPADAAPSEQAAQCRLIRCTFGPLPFRPIALDPGWLRAAGDLVPGLARALHEERSLPAGTLDPLRLAILADALEDAGCASADLLDHCRQADTLHVRGCWALDLVLARK